MILTVILIIILLIALAVAYWLGLRTGAFKRDKWWETQLPGHRREAILKSRAVLGGYFSEQLSPFLPNFKYPPTECRFVGKPIDFLVFRGMDNKKIQEVVFVEVKSGDSKLSSIERGLKDVIKKKKVKWEEYRVPKKLTKGLDVGEIIDEE